MTAKVLLIAVVATCFVSAQAQISGSSSNNPDGSKDVKLEIAKVIGEPDHNVKVGVIAAGNSNSNTPTVGAYGQYNIKDHILGVSKTITPGESDIFSQNARLNILKNDNVRLDANVFNSHTKLKDGFEFDKRGGSLDFLHRQGHGVSVGASHIPKFGTTADIFGKANVWKSNSGLSTLGVTGSASRTFGGPFNGRNNFGGGLMFNHRF